jgi:hypothetical protein
MFKDIDKVLYVGNETSVSMAESVGVEFIHVGTLSKYV